MLKNRKSAQVLNLFATTFIVVQSLALNAQDSANTVNKVSIASPTAASLGKYGDYPVNYNTGVPQISIPLYTIESKDIKVSISLSYHASGLKVQEAASWVGAGWSLNAGGVITRSVVGVPDDRGNGPTSFTHGYYSDYGFHNYLWESGSGYGSTADGMKTNENNFVNGYRDGEPDMFTFNVGGVSGKFYFNDDRTPVIVPEQNIKIQTDYTSGIGFTGFILITSDGTKYFFGESGNNGAVDPIEMTVPMTLQDGPAFAQKANSSWYLNKIVSIDGTDSVLFNYVAEDYSYYTLSMFPVSYYAKSTLGSVPRAGYNLVKNLIQGVRLSQIISTNGTVYFNPSSSARTDLAKGWPTIIGHQANTSAYSLGDVQINNNNGFCKKYVFKYSYFQDNSTLKGVVLTNSAFSTVQTDKYRLKLDSLQEMSCDGSLQVPPYKFAYYAGTVPRTLSLAVDHWGFYNGATLNQELIPTHLVKFQGLITKKPGADRDAAFPAMRGGTLQTISYPTGGSTTFEYEPNTTYVDYDTYTFVQSMSMSSGYDGHNGYLGDGGSNPQQVPKSLSGNAYELTISNTDNINVATEGAMAVIYNSNMAQVFSTGTVNPGETKLFNIQLSAGSYYVFLSKTNASVGYGVSLALTEKVPTPVSANDTVGGLRIKTITTSNAFNSQSSITSFSYNIGSQSSGILYSRPVYVKVVKNKTFNKTFPVPPNPDCTVLLAGTGGGFDAYVADQYYLSPSSVRPMQTIQGNHIGYNEVKVTQSGNGYSIFRYYGSNYWDSHITDVCTRIVDWDNTCDPDIPETPAAPVEIEPMRGELKYEADYNESGQVVRDKWHYPLFVKSNFPTQGFITTIANNAGVFTYYDLNSYKKLRDSTEETVYHPGVSSSITTTNISYYASLYHRDATQKVMHNSTGDRVITNLSYVFDYLPSTCTSISDGVSTYLSNVHVDTLNFDSVVVHCTPQSGSNTCRYPALQQFRRNLTLHRLSFIQYRWTNFTDAVNTFQTNHNTAKSNAGADYKPVLELQDLHSNQLVESSQWKNNLLTRSEWTLFAFSTNPSGKVYPYQTHDIPIYSPTSTFTKSVVNGSNSAFVKDSRYVVNSTFKHDLGNLVEITSRDGVVTAFKWGINNSKPIVKAIGVDYATLNTAFNAVGGNLTTLRSQSTLSTALISTFTYEKMVGITSETDPGLLKVTYDYDALFRLLHIRDANNNILKRMEYKYQRPGTE